MIKNNKNITKKCDSDVMQEQTQVRFRYETPKKRPEH